MWPAADVATPAVGDYELRILSPTILELFLVNTKAPDPAPVDSWDWVNDRQVFVPPSLTNITVLVNGQTQAVARVGFKRRPVYATFPDYDLRIGNQLYLELAQAIPAGPYVRVTVTNSGTLWPSQQVFENFADPLRLSLAIHVNQEGYLPAYRKIAEVGYYLGDLGELTIPTNRFFVVDAQTSTNVFSGTLTRRPDTGYNYTPTPYQHVYEADFSALTNAGQFRVLVPGMGASLPFRIDDGVAMAFARTYALGMFHQRSGFDVALPFTRFTHALDHVAPAAVPTNDASPFAFTWETVTKYCTEVNPDNPPQVAPSLTNYANQLFPFVKQGTVSVSGGHFEAGDYNRVAWNGAQLVHLLVFAVDSLPGVGALDNLGLPESGDDISDALQEAKWEADFLARLQDSDGGFYYSVYPRDREYEMDVLPENGDPQVIWPKNTATTAAAVAALAQCSSSPMFRQAYPQTASNYWAQAKAGWRFLTNALARFGPDGAYQKVQHFDDDFTDHDELAWAACEMFLASGDPQYAAKLTSWFPDPTDVATFRWGWQRMAVCYGNAIRDYASSVSSGRLTVAQIDTNYLARCINVITNCGNDILTWSQENAYGTSFPDLSKAYRSGGWYFSSEQAMNLAVAYQFNPSPLYMDALLRNMNYEAGCNPVNVSFVTGLGWKRPRNIVDLYSLNDRRTLPKDGVPISNIITGFEPVWTYGWELLGLVYPPDSADTAPYAYYDRWCDDWNVSTEGSTTDMARSFVAVAWLAARTGAANYPWRTPSASITVVPAAPAPGQPVSLTLNVPDDLSAARVVWEAAGQEPSFNNGPSGSFTFTSTGNYWVEAEAQWPDGRRIFAANSVLVGGQALLVLGTPRINSSGQFTFTLTGTPGSTCVIQASSDLINWSPIATNAISSTGGLTFSDPAGIQSSPRYYRAVQSP